MNNRIFGVTELNEYIRDLLDIDPVLNGIYVKGELSNYKIYPSGHHYFTMKDAEGSLRCVMFKGSASKLRFRPENGMKAVAFGRIAVFPRDGVYQLYVNELTPDGVGDLYVAFEQLKEKLLKEGLFDSSHKKPIPRFPGRIAVITSSAGAAVRDIIRVLGKRWPLSKVVVLPVRVQGAEAPPEIVGAIRYANRHRIADVIITGRGGGSIEDLWAFNDERVARAIYDSEIPVISAVGHEPDVTIADFVADLRAATPSNAAELAVPDSADLREALLQLELRTGQALKRELKMLRQRLNELAQKRVLQSPKNYIDDKRMLVDFMSTRLNAAAAKKVTASREHYIRLAASLDAMSPLKVLGRGYAITRKEDGTVVKAASDVKSGDRITVRLRKDEVKATVE
ncbi:Exodeoxyribonuclease VII large subunit [Sporobacter termitidis DSM 10068]|uniref:Exodeoxyribonuclease 7 large subunit n=1 Tax=Sporobacter termitidis DSM 10068 TaxID=1123282 RepID=A0A1M5Y8P9_9FIRM|nr:exodeoxyribonuclease VII large subunit [Sporobacter termitidis]SHI08194.1 Exodeoxyribonuclease VII large subunit [Sporobacter termitidis DSM 10068]